MRANTSRKIVCGVLLALTGSIGCGGDGGVTTQATGSDTTTDIGLVAVIVVGNLTAGGTGEGGLKRRVSRDQPNQASQ